MQKTKTLVCGHEQTFSTPVPSYGDTVYCYRCKDYSKVPPKPQLNTVAEGRPRRLKENPKANNKYTKGREICG